MANIKQLTTNGEQTVTATGAITGTLDTSALSTPWSIHVRVRDLTAGKKIMIAIEDTASGTAFSDALQVAVFHFEGTGSTGTAAAENEMEQSKEWYDIPATLYGGTNNKLRGNCLRIGTATTCKVDIWVAA